MINHRLFWEIITVGLLLICLAHVLNGLYRDDPDMFRAATPIGAMSIATGTLALVRAGK